MLATCVLSGWDVDTYSSPEHPLQQSLRTTSKNSRASSVAHTAVDGCGAPAFAIPLRALAASYRSAVLAPHGTPASDVADAMCAHPQMVCGEESEVTGLMRAVPGLLVKDGAESVYVAALPDGRAVALKIADGGIPRRANCVGRGFAPDGDRPASGRRPCRPGPLGNGPGAWPRPTRWSSSCSALKLALLGRSSAGAAGLLVVQQVFG